MLETFRKLEEQIGNFFGEFENELNSTYRNRALPKYPSALNRSAV
jgi:hypothetical protein